MVIEPSDGVPPQPFSPAWLMMNDTSGSRNVGARRERRGILASIEGKFPVIAVRADGLHVEVSRAIHLAGY
jgi:hypothetical protein